MIYSLFQAQEDLAAPARLMAGLTAAWLDQAWGALPRPEAVKRLAASCTALAHGGARHTRPAFGLETTLAGNRTVAVREEVVARTPFATLLRFAKEGVEGQPKILVVAPLSGHFATLLRGTVRVLLPDNDVYITDWHNARDVPAAAGVSASMRASRM